MIFEDGNYRTTGLNEAVALIGQFQQEFGRKKTEHLVLVDQMFGNMRKGGLEPPRDFSHYHLKVARMPFRHFRMKEPYYQEGVLYARENCLVGKKFGN